MPSSQSQWPFLTLWLASAISSHRPACIYPHVETDEVPSLIIQPGSWGFTSDQGTIVWPLCRDHKPVRSRVWNAKQIHQCLTGCSLGPRPSLRRFKDPVPFRSRSFSIEICLIQREVCFKQLSLYWWTSLNTAGITVILVLGNGILREYSLHTVLKLPWVLEGGGGHKSWLAALSKTAMCLEAETGRQAETTWAGKGEDQYWAKGAQSKVQGQSSHGHGGAPWINTQLWRGPTPPSCSHTESWAPRFS